MKTLLGKVQLSAGQNRRIALAKLWLCDAKLWILDEPLTAIDKQGVRVLTDTFEAHVNQGGSVIFTTHQDMPFEHIVASYQIRNLTCRHFII